MTLAERVADDGRQPSSGLYSWAAVALCVAGAALRVAMYAQHRSLWYDEAALAVNIVNRGFGELVAPLDHLQTAPLLFLWVERALVLSAGPNEWALRLLSLAAGIALPPLTWRVAGRVLPPSAALVAVALVAFSPTLVRYSAEVKPYVTDALVTVVLLDRALAAGAAGASAMTWWSLGVAGIIAIVSSTPAVFVLAGVVTYLAARSMTRGGGAQAIARATVVALCWAAAFAVLLVTVFRPVVDRVAPLGRFMQWYWATNFLTSDPPGLRTKVSALLWAVLPNTFLGAGAVPGMTTALALIVALGVAALVTNGRARIAVLFIVPIIAVVIASMLRRYPIAERLVLFAAPVTALLIASAPLIVDRVSRPLQRWVSGAAVAGVAALATVGVVAMYRSTEGRQETRDLVRAALAERVAGTPVWVSAGGDPAWRFYSGDGANVTLPSATTGPGLPAGGKLAPDVLVGAWSTAIPERIVPVADDTAAAGRPSPWSEAEALRLRRIARPCVLVFLSHAMPGESPALLSSAAALGGRLTRSKRQPGAELHRVCFDVQG